MKSLIFIPICLMLIAASCRHCPGPDVSNITSDQLVVKLNEENKFNEAKPGEIIKQKNLKVIKFTSIGQQYTIKIDEPFQLVFSNLDFNRANIKTQKINNDSIKLTIIDPWFDEVALNDECDIVHTTGFQIPFISLKEGMSWEKIILVPLFNENSCIHNGWQVRYGERERIYDNCSSNQKIMIKSAQSGFDRCSEKRIHIKRKPENLTEIIFGIK